MATTKAEEEWDHEPDIEWDMDEYGEHFVDDNDYDCRAVPSLCGLNECCGLAYLGDHRDHSMHEMEYVCNRKDLNLYFSDEEGQPDKNFKC